MTSPPTISVIIPCYNHGKYIDDTIASVLLQTYPCFEIIVVNDGSTDPLTIDKIKGLTSQRIKVHRIERQGPGAARNWGFSHSTGDYLLLLDADDMFERTFVEKAVLQLNNYSKLGAVSSYTLCFGYEDYLWYPQGGSVTNFLYKNTSPACSLIRRQAWIEAGGFDTGLFIGYEDWDFWIRMTKKDWLVHIIPEILFFYRQKDQSRAKVSYSNLTTIHKVIRQNHPDLFND